MDGANIYLTWMMLLASLNCVWLVVTFVTDF